MFSLFWPWWFLSRQRLMFQCTSWMCINLIFTKCLVPCHFDIPLMYGRPRSKFADWSRGSQHLKCVPKKGNVMFRNNGNNFFCFLFWYGLPTLYIADQASRSNNTHVCRHFVAKAMLHGCPSGVGGCYLLCCIVMCIETVASIWIEALCSTQK